jgi:hypothetical protein
MELYEKILTVREKTMEKSKDYLKREGSVFSEPSSINLKNKGRCNSLNGINLNKILFNY